MKNLALMSPSVTEHNIESSEEEQLLGTEHTFKDFSSSENTCSSLEEFLSSIGEISSYSCTSPVEEREECLKAMHIESHANSLGGLLSSCNTTGNCSSAIYSDGSTKRHKSDSQDQSFAIEAHEAGCNNSREYADGTTVDSSKKVTSDRYREKSQGDAVVFGGRSTDLENEFMKSLMLSLPTISQNSEQRENCLSDQSENSCYSAHISHNNSELYSDAQENMKSFCHDAHINQANDELYSDAQENIKNTNNTVCYVDMHPEETRISLDYPKRDSYLSKPYEGMSGQVDSGFVTGNNKKILVDPSNITLVDDSHSTKAKTQENFGVLPDINDDVSLNLTIDSSFPIAKHVAMKPTLLASSMASANGNGSSNSPGPDLLCNATEIAAEPSTGRTMSSRSITRPIDASYENSTCRHCPPEECEPDLEMIEMFCNVQKHFQHCEHRWVFEQFKWAWLHMFLAQTHESSNLESEIIDIMSLKLKSEHSVLRRIVEFDDVPFRFMVLGVIGVEESSVELYDGFYSLKFEIDKNIHTMLKRARCDLGSRLYVFGSDILLRKPTSIFDVEGNALKLHYNSTRVCNDCVRLGSTKKISFLNNISRILPDGGVVSAVIVKIQKIVELKYLVSVENYRNRVDDLEKEMEKIHEIAEKVGYAISLKDITIRKFCKMIVEDESGECVLTWWSPPELRTAETYKLVYLTPVRGSWGLHLSTSKKTYFERVE